MKIRIKVGNAELEYVQTNLSTVKESSFTSGYPVTGEPSTKDYQLFLRNLKEMINMVVEANEKQYDR